MSIPDGVADYNQQFLDALEFVDDVIQNQQHAKVSVWRSMIPRGAYQLGEGLVKKLYRFYPGAGDQRGLQRWRPIQISRVAAGSDPGVDACAYNPYTVDYGFEVVNYTGFQTERRTKHICVRDIRFTWQFKQQLALVMGYLGDITNSVWENYAREQYIKLAVDASQGYVLSQGAPNTYAFAYDPFTVDSDGDNVITIDHGIPVSTLDWSYMRWLGRWCQMQVPMGPVATRDGRPQFGLVLDLEDFDQMIERNADLREDFRYAAPSILVENYGQVTAFKEFVLMHDMAAPRFVVKSDDGTSVTLKRVDPMIETDAGTAGVRVDVNPEYLNAEFALAAIYMKDVFEIDVPPAGPSAPGGGTSFGATPSLNGEFDWVNIPNEQTNILGEVGFYFGRYEAFPKPLTNSDEPIVFLYRRCPQATLAECGTGGNEAVASPATATDISLVSGSTTALTMAMPAIIDAEPPKVITVEVDAGSSYTCIIGDGSAAPTYTIYATSAADAALIDAGSAWVVSW